MFFFVWSHVCVCVGREHANDDWERTQSQHNSLMIVFVPLLGGDTLLLLLRFDHLFNRVSKNEKKPKGKRSKNTKKFSKQASPEDHFAVFFLFFVASS